MELLQKFKDWWDRTISKESRKRLAKWFRRLLIVGVFVYLLVQLSEIGLREILLNLPTHPLFYIIFVGMYLGLPLAETVIYRKLWGLSLRSSLPVLLQKRVYNKDVLNYSGEAHLYMWARKHVDRSDRLLLRDMKDNTVLSSLASMLLALTLLGTFLFTGLLPLESLLERVQTGWALGGAFCLALLIALAIRFRRSVIALPMRTALVLFGIHLGRLLFVQTLQILQWMVVMPEAPIQAWFSFLSLQIVVNQLPLIPAKELVVLGASGDLSRWVRISESGVAGMLLVSFVLDKLLNLILFAYLSWRGTHLRNRDTNGVADYPVSEASQEAHVDP
jgi:hypothetical protein